MVIEIDESCIELINEEKYSLFFNKLAYYMYNGKNYIYITKLFLEKLYKSEKIDSKAQNIYKNVFNNSVEDVEVLKIVNRRILIIANSDKDIEIQDSIILVTIDKAIEINFFENKSNLICENLSDCKFFTKIEEIYCKNNRIYSKNIAFEYCPGGGSTIFDMYNEKTRVSEISLLIVDSDQKYKNAPIGSTMKKVLDERKENSLVEVYPLYVHEIENLIPIKMIDNYYKTSRTEEKRQETINFLKAVECKSFEKSPIVYFDMKNGISSQKWNENDNYKKYWKDIINEIRYTIDESKVNIISGFGTNLMRKMSAYLDFHMDDDNFVKENIDDSIIEYWNDIGKLMYSYSCSRARSIY